MNLGTEALGSRFWVLGFEIWELECGGTVPNVAQKNQSLVNFSSG